ncbi:DinB family protein [Spirosoma rhododendri]|uniref:DinB family protein n=1 Tax=Spirosoma rhododendri TaxID=2728024 RepID=A0A7L5DPT8_9BACT|nr:hypothetical protein [Spirosoma rhododendri]QJD79213.1 DinB family protein [Spirosoma rhododendri]
MPITVDDAYLVPFLPATKPERMIDEPEIATIKELFISSIDRLQADFDEQKFVNYSPSKWVATKYGVDVMNIDEALDFLLYHEGYHCGYILALRHLV